MRYILRGIVNQLWFWVEYNIICLHKKDVYLRRKGAKVGEDCQIITSLNNFASEPYLIKIGNRVTITAGVKLITHDASTRLFRDRIDGMNKKYGNLFGAVQVGNNVFIGVDTILLPNTKIGDNTVIGAGAVVKGEFPPNVVIVGVPARQVSSLDDYIKKVQQKMIPIHAQTREQLKTELINYFQETE